MDYKPTSLCEISSEAACNQSRSDAFSDASGNKYRYTRMYYQTANPAVQMLDQLQEMPDSRVAMAGLQSSGILHILTPV